MEHAVTEDKNKNEEIDLLDYLVILAKHSEVSS